LGQNDNETYLRHYDTHPEEFPDEPYIGGRCGTFLIEMVRKGETTWDEINGADEERDTKWKEYHLAKARELGFEIDADRLRRYFPRNMGGNFIVFE
jgi:hypothetical protein